MAKYSSATKTGQKKGDTVDYSGIVPTGTLSEILQASLDKTASANAGSNGELGQEVIAKATDVSPIQDLAEIRQEPVAKVRQQVSEDPAQYNEFSEMYEGEDTNLAQSGSGIGIGPGYEAKTPGSYKPSGVGAITALAKKQAEGTATEEELERLATMGPETWAGEGFRGAPDLFDPSNPMASLRSGAEASGVIPYAARLEMIGDGYEMGRKVQGEMDKLSFELNPEEQINLIEDMKTKGYNPTSVREYINAFVSNYAQVKEQGVPEAFSDLAMHAVLHSVRQSMKAATNSEGDKTNEQLLTSQERKDLGLKLQAGSHERIGRLIEDAMGVKGTNVTSTIAGALAESIVTKALPEMFVKNKKGQYFFNPDMVDKLDSLQELTSIILPTAKRVVRNSPTVDPSKITAPRKSDPKLKGEGKYGSFEFANDTIDVLNNIQYSVDTDLTGIINVLVGQESTNGGTLIDELIGTTSTDGSLNNRNPFRPRLDPKTGQPMVNENYVFNSFDFKTKDEFVMERYLGDKVKDTKFNETMDFAEENANKRIFYDHFLGSNNRFYVDQTVGNFQSDKLSRALLQAASLSTYDLNSPMEINLLKAGIAKKYGYTKLGVMEAAAKFDEHAAAWAGAVADLQGEGGKTLINEAKAEEGWMSLSAMVEGAKLFDAIQQNNIGSGGSQYQSKFFTEVDGVANGLGHNALQAGDLSVAGATNLNPLVTMVQAGVGRQGIDTDVYQLAGQGMKAQIAKNSADDSGLLSKVFSALGLDDSKMLRDFSKKPLMIFGYGAGASKIKLHVTDQIDKLLQDPTTSAAVHQALGGADIQKVKDRLGEMMVEGVNTNFPQIKEMARVLSQIAAEAIEQGIDPSALTIEGHAVLFGLSTREIEGDKSFTDQGITVRPQKRVVDPAGRTFTRPGMSYSMKADPTSMVPNPYYNKDIKGSQKMVPEGSLKAAAQAAVLMTHANDGINIGRTFQALAKLPGGVSAAQIFDGILVKPKDAAVVAAQLNKDFVDINKNHSNLLALKAELDKQGFNWGKTNATRKLRQKIDTLDKARQRILQKISYNKTKQFFWD